MSKQVCLLATSFIVLMLVPPAWAGGLFRVHPDNPRYFTDDSGAAIYLAGHQWFNDLQHNAWNFPVEVDWDRYLDFMQERKMNYRKPRDHNRDDSGDSLHPEVKALREFVPQWADGQIRFALDMHDRGFAATTTKSSMAPAAYEVIKCRRQF